jgi:spore germination cell wall hydrolase CwlJ-like protein
MINEPNAVEDPTNGATHFHATYINWQPTWRRVKDSVNQIGNHVFYRIKPKEEK